MIKEDSKKLPILPFVFTIEYVYRDSYNKVEYVFNFR